MRPAVLTVVGARPQFIKAAVVSARLRELGESRPFDEVLVNTGQHYDHAMSGSFFEDLKIPEPRFNLGIGSGTAGYQIGAMVKAIYDVIAEVKPAAVLAYGDTHSTLSASIAATHSDTPFIHVEAGERIYLRREVPEEVNRVIADHVAALCLTSTERARRYLMREGHSEERMKFVGDPMYDLFLLGVRQVESKPAGVLERLGLTPGDYHLATIHRAGNTSEKSVLLGLLNALDNASKRVLFPVHPRVRKLLDEWGWSPAHHLILTEPLPYFEMTEALLGAHRVVTDSGGLTREAFFAGKPCILPMERTWWVEVMEAGWLTLCGTDAVELARLVDSFEPTHPAPQGLFGDGNAAAKIVEEVGRFLERGLYDELWGEIN